MPLCVAPLFAVSLGLCFGLLTLDGRGARGYLAARSSVRLFAAVALFPALLFTALLRPAWATMHFVGRPPSAVLLAGAAVAAALVPLVYERADVLATLSRAKAAAFATLPAALGLVVMLLLHRRAFVLTPAVPRLAEAESLFGSAMGVAFVLVDVLLLAGACLTGFALADDPRPSEEESLVTRRISRGGLPARPKTPRGGPAPKPEKSFGARPTISPTASSDADGVVRQRARGSLASTRTPSPTKRRGP